MPRIPKPSVGNRTGKVGRPNAYTAHIAGNHQASRDVEVIIDNLRAHYTPIGPDGKLAQNPLEMHPAEAAMRTLSDIASGRDPFNKPEMTPSRVAACRIVLERYLGKPKTQVAVTIGTKEPTEDLLAAKVVESAKKHINGD